MPILSRQIRRITIFYKLLLYIVVLFGTSHISTCYLTASATNLTSVNTNNNADTSNSQDFSDMAEQVKLRSSYRNLSANEIQKMSYTKIFKIKECGFYGHSIIRHDYVLKEINNEKVVIDHATGLMWHQSGSTQGMNWEKANRWIKRLNTKGYAGHHDWRLPTVEEAASLLEPEKVHLFLPHDADAAEYYKLFQSDYPQERNQSPLLKDKRGRFIDPIFDKTQGWIWTGDSYQSPNAAWRVDYFSGLVDWDIYYYIFYFVRPVRTLE
ncbi:MAG: hypothetical protein SCABRO_00521 [Candidatus Scalindua brodae]|uniref:Lcl C-terminal domain-containing protein n=1 Tax=Candidatus Scalindua brodae TaxID=237368 RepID=A0A0B0ESR5_9BACT|nr:MAG: hypothetical protein SCABRO_00521 [Candidatus Scalindua brodae]